MSSIVLEELHSNAVTAASPVPNAHEHSSIEARSSGTGHEDPIGADPRIGKYLTFLLGREEFAVRVVKVREIMGVQHITAVPQTAPYIKGVINLRGKVVPVVDLRLKFGLPEVAYTQRTCIIVVQVSGSGTESNTGLIVDEVSEVLNLAQGDIEDTPDFGSGASSASGYLLGMAKVKGRVRILLDIDRALAAQEVNGNSALACN